MSCIVWLLTFCIPYLAKEYVNELLSNLDQQNIFVIFLFNFLMNSISERKKRKNNIVKQWVLVNSEI